MLPLFVRCLKLSVIAVPIFFLIEIHLRFTRRFAFAYYCSSVLYLPHKVWELFRISTIELKCVSRCERTGCCVHTFGCTIRLNRMLLLLWITWYRRHWNAEESSLDTFVLLSLCHFLLLSWVGQKRRETALLPLMLSRRVLPTTLLRFLHACRR